MTRRPQVLFYALHLLGVGHVHRAAQLCSALTRLGLDVDLVLGGPPLEEMTIDCRSLTQLPPIAVTDASYSTYVDGEGQPLGAAWMANRQAQLLAQFETAQPDAILIEAFPFGRRVVRHELRALLDAAEQRRPKPLIVSSVRDVLHENRKPGRAEETVATVKRFFDHVLVHADPALVTLADSFSLAQDISDRIAYSGFVTKHAKPSRVTPLETDIVVSAGGGAFGEGLLRAALDAAKADPNRRWLLITGRNAPADVHRHLSDAVPAHVRVERYVPDLPGQMRTAKITVSQCGYNTAMDALGARDGAGTAIVFVPHDGGNQTEQLKRSRLLEQNGFCVCLPETELSTPRLLAAMNQAVGLPSPTKRILFDGARRSADMILDWIGAHRHAAR
ncbi:MAG: glycosyltransferase [Pseudomonadota bacterium]